MKVGFISHRTRLPASTQRKSLLAFGVAEQKIYDESRGEHRTDALRDIRAGDELVVHRLSVLARDRRDWRILAALIGERAITVTEASTGRTATLPAALPEMWADCLDDWAGERNKMTKAQARKAGAKGAAKRWGNRKVMPAHEALPIWRDVIKYPTIADALAVMIGWTQRSAYAKLGKRGALAGRPLKQR